MKKYTFIAVLLTFALSVPALNAAELKIGVVNAAKVLDQSPQKAKALARLEKEFSSRSKSLEQKFKNLNRKTEKLKKDSAILTAEKRQAQERKLLSEQRELNRQKDEFGEDLSIRRNEEIRKLEKDIAQTIVDIAKKEGYDIVVYQGVIYASDKADITAKVLQKLKSK